MPKTTPASGGAKRYPLNMRTTKETRARLERTAAANGRSLAQEVESRLERSFEHDDLLPELLARHYGPQLAGLLMMVGAGMLTASTSRRGVSFPGDEQWLADPELFDVAAFAASEVLLAARPTSEAEDVQTSASELEEHDDALIAFVAARTAEGRRSHAETVVAELIKLVQQKKTTTRWPDTEHVRRLLGPLADHLSAAKDRSKRGSGNE